MLSWKDIEEITSYPFLVDRGTNLKEIYEH